MRLHDLIDYNELNKEGFRKALKKHDKVLSRVAPKRLDDERPRWEAVLSDTSKEKLQVNTCFQKPLDCIQYVGKAAFPFSLAQKVFFGLSSKIFTACPLPTMST